MIMCSSHSHTNVNKSHTNVHSNNNNNSHVNIHNKKNSNNHNSAAGPRPWRSPPGRSGRQPYDRLMLGI